MSTDITVKTVQSSEITLQIFDSSILAGQVSPSTMAMYERDFAAYLTFVGTFEEAVCASTLARWRTHLAQETKKSPNTINRMLSAVKRLMREAAIQGYLASAAAAEFNLVSGVKAVALKERTKQNARVRIEPEEMRQVCNSPDSSELIGLRDNALLATLASGALRVSELADLTQQQIRPKDQGYILLIRGKNDLEYRDAPLSREAYRHIQIWLQARPVKSDHIFTAFDGRGQRITDRPLSNVGVWKIVRKYSVENGLTDVKPHDFRRFVGTQLARKDIRIAQKALGHKQIETTVRHYVLDELEVGITDDLY